MGEVVSLEARRKLTGSPKPGGTAAVLVLKRMLALTRSRTAQLRGAEVKPLPRREGIGPSPP